jgi:hypothetical protein
MRGVPAGLAAQRAWSPYLPVCLLSGRGRHAGLADAQRADRHTTRTAQRARSPAGSSIRPSSVIRRTAAALVRQSSLSMLLRTCISTVRGLRNS